MRRKYKFRYLRGKIGGWRCEDYPLFQQMERSRVVIGNLIDWTIRDTRCNGKHPVERLLCTYTNIFRNFDDVA